jgi:hypothetical protein
MLCIGEMPEEKNGKTFIKKMDAPYICTIRISEGTWRSMSALQCNGMMQPGSVNTDPGIWVMDVRLGRRRSTGTVGKM